MVAVAVISDVHANLEALEAVLEEVGGMELYCLGDLVDYGAEPNEVIEELRLRGTKCVLGNHDVAAITGDTSQFNARAAMSSQWTGRRLTGDSIGFIEGLPSELRLTLGEVGVYFTHGSPDDRLWEYVDPRTHTDLFGYYLDKVDAQVIGLGHTHVPYVWREAGRAVFNPGSVGQPRDGDRRAAYALLSAEGGEVEVEIRRVEYDYAKAAGKIRGAGLPERFAVRLEEGT
ncbi:MAG: metallophosphoesterase family protein [Thaumarchaeota archaeon]|nr:metallophosphoesterase family protein [Nitrososphaerota archaeon]